MAETSGMGRGRGQGQTALVSGARSPDATAVSGPALFEAAGAAEPLTATQELEAQGRLLAGIQEMVENNQARQEALRDGLTMAQLALAEQRAREEEAALAAQRAHEMAVQQAREQAEAARAQPAQPSGIQSADERKQQLHRTSEAFLAARESDALESRREALSQMVESIVEASGPHYKKRWEREFGAFAHAMGLAENAKGGASEVLEVMTRRRTSTKTAASWPSEASSTAFFAASG